ncbi:hypothetical protein SLEP1_g22291 [Rubroshorea leprosula]|uniref:Uncharacterized protein n=1 Tax=Rubroshorea leprosula TaxID=152421 RepID=A0AAV5JI28_9ROSI|nr:hypothetical protein SLEP1_g22291 [Rubroshorea leprosula]
MLFSTQICSIRPFKTSRIFLALTRVTGPPWNTPCPREQKICHGDEALSGISCVGWSSISAGDMITSDADLLSHVA